VGEGGVEGDANQFDLFGWKNAALVGVFGPHTIDALRPRHRGRPGPMLMVISSGWTQGSSIVPSLVY
jgi:hypothetical protein